MIAASTQSGTNLPGIVSLCSQTTGRSGSSSWLPQLILRLDRWRSFDPMVPSGYPIPPDLHPHSFRPRFGGAVGSHTSHYFAVLKGGFALEGKRRATVPILRAREHRGRRIQRRRQPYDWRRTAEFRLFRPTINNLGRR